MIFADAIGGAKADLVQIRMAGSGQPRSLDRSYQVTHAEKAQIVTTGRTAPQRPLTEELRSRTARRSNLLEFDIVWRERAQPFSASVATAAFRLIRRGIVIHPGWDRV